jgi:hypothetical protein
MGELSMVLAQARPKPDLHVCRCHASEGNTVALVVRKVVDRCTQVGGRVHLLLVHHSWTIEDELHLAVVDDGLVHQLVILRELLTMRRHLVS